MIAEVRAEAEKPYGVRKGSCVKTSVDAMCEAGIELAAGPAAGIKESLMPRSVIAALGLTASAFCLTSCGGGDSSLPPTSPSPSAAMTINVTGQNGAQSFSPNPATAGGQMVVFRNADSIPHRVVLNDGSVDTGDIAPGTTSRAVQMPVSGTNYHCSLHPAMVGAVNASGGAAPPPCEGIYCDRTR